MTDLLLENPDDWGLFLDLDGTLIDIAATPHDVSVPPELAPLLGRLVASFAGAVGIISGRRVSDIDRFLAPLKLSAAGVHGSEMRTTPEGEVRDAAEPIAPKLVEAVTNTMSRLSDRIMVEAKGSALVVHYRAEPSAGPAIETELSRLLEHGPDHLILSPGRKIFEVVPVHVSKGTALARLAQLPPFRSRRPIMIGDDVSDESAIEAATGLGGLGLKVAGEHFAKASADFEGPAHVRAWLSDLAQKFER